jgi:hypothetical protein
LDCLRDKKEKRGGINMINYIHIFRFIRKSFKVGCNKIVFSFNEDGTYNAEATYIKKIRISNNIKSQNRLRYGLIIIGLILIASGDYYWRFIR